MTIVAIIKLITEIEKPVLPISPLPIELERVMEKLQTIKKANLKNLKIQKIKKQKVEIIY